MTFYFAWVGGAPTAAFSMATIGDVWGGSWRTLGDTWGGSLSTTADIPPSPFLNTLLAKPVALTNLRDIAGLVEGRSYFIRGAGIPSRTTWTGAPQPILLNYLFSGKIGPGPLNTFSNASQVGNVTFFYGYSVRFTYNGNHAGTLEFGSEPAEALPVVIYTQTDSSGFSQHSNEVFLADVTPLVVGDTYRIEGSGIQEETFFTYQGGNFVTITKPALQSAHNVELTISRETDRNKITNLADTSGLVVGQTYQIFGKGVPESCLGTFQGDGTILLSQPATATATATFLRIYLGITYPDGGPFDPSYARNDETVLGVKIEHSEGNFPLLTVDLKNPRVGLLAPTRNVWCWLSWQASDTDPITPLFHGRLISIPANVQNEKVSLQFLAQPTNYRDLQIQAMQSLMVDPYFDPIWFTNGLSTPETILEARSASWHIDRTSLAVTVSDITIGEDGSLVVGESEHLYNEMEFRYSNPPLSGVFVEATVTWTQQDVGSVDLTAFLGGPILFSYSGDGLVQNWPAPETNIGGGWKVGRATFASEYTAFGLQGLEVTWESGWFSSYLAPQMDMQVFGAIFPLMVISFQFTVDYEASRPWTETVTFLLESDVQQVITDSRASIEPVRLSSDLLTQPIDPGGTMPLRDFRDNSYFKTDRGQQSFRYLLSYARARLVARARAVDIEFTTTFEKAMGLSCRWNATVNDGRLPGGSATGKVKQYQLIANQHDGMRARIVIGCTIGNGGSQAASATVGSYVDDGYVDAGYQAIGGTIDIGDGTIVYQSFDAFDIEDDGVSFFTMTPNRVVDRYYLAGDKDSQVTAIRASVPTPATNNSMFSVPSPAPDPSKALDVCFTNITLQMVPVTGGSFASIFAVDVSKLSIPKTIDLEAA